MRLQILTGPQKRSCTKRLVKDRADEIRNLYLLLLHEDGRNFQPWLQFGISHAWIEHSQRLGGLFNPSLIPEIALVLRRSEYDLHLALRDSQSRLILRDKAIWSVGKDSN